MTNSKKPPIALIVALDEQNGIGRAGGLLCHLPADLKHFRELTTGHCIVMGRKTYHSLPHGALPNRTNIVVTSDRAENYPGCIVARSVDEALSHCPPGDTVFIIGGGELYRSTLPLAHTLYFTRIHHVFEDADTFFPPTAGSEWELTHEETFGTDEKNPFPYSFRTYIRR